MVFNNIQIYITVSSVQLSAFILLIGVAAWKIFLTIQNARSKPDTLLLSIHSSLLLSALISTSMQIFQLIQQFLYQEVNLQTVMMINVFNLLTQAIIIFMFSYYWKKTDEFIKSEVQSQSLSTETTLKFQIFAVLVTTIFYLVYFSYVLGSENRSVIISYLTYYFWQLLGVILLLWGIFSQLNSGNQLRQSINQCSQLIKSNLNKTRFNTVYWITSVVFFVRMLFLVSVTIALVTFVEDTSYDFWAVYLYTFTDAIPVLSYILSIKIQRKVTQDQQNLVDRTQSKSSNNSRNSSKNSRHNTELSEQFKAQDTGVE